MTTSLLGTRADRAPRKRLSALYNRGRATKEEGDDDEERVEPGFDDDVGKLV